MAEQTFTSGQILTAAQMTTLQTNIGLAFISSTTVGTAVSTVSIPSVFSSTYDNYEIIYTGGAASAVGNLALQMTGTTTGYYGVLIYALPSGGGVSAATVNNAASWTYAGDHTNTGGAKLSCTLYAPNLAARTGIAAKYVGTGTSSGAFGTFNASLDNATQYTGFTVAPGSGTITGGTISVYGYRK